MSSRHSPLGPAKHIDRRSDHRPTAAGVAKGTIRRAHDGSGAMPVVGRNAMRNNPTSFAARTPSVPLGTDDHRRARPCTCNRVAHHQPSAFDLGFAAITHPTAYGPTVRTTSEAPDVAVGH